jgi:hypothetical protein
MTGAAIVRGEVLAPTLILTIVAWLLTVTALLLWADVSFERNVSAFDRLSWAIACMLVVPGVILVQIVLQNALAVLFPAWMDLGATSARGMEVMGQRVLSASGLIVAVGVALLPAVVVAALVSWAAYVLTGFETVVLAGATTSATLCLESAMVIAWLGRAVDRMDAGAVPPAE